MDRPTSGWGSDHCGRAFPGKDADIQGMFEGRKPMENQWKTYGTPMENLWKTNGKGWVTTAETWFLKLDEISWKWLRIDEKNDSTLIFFNIYD